MKEYFAKVRVILVLVLAQHLAIGRASAIPALGLKQLGQQKFGADLGNARPCH